MRLPTCAAKLVSSITREAVVAEDAAKIPTSRTLEITTIATITTTKELAPSRRHLIELCRPSLAKTSILEDVP